jgi:non-ribosomal peptide synthetase component F
MLLTDSWFNEKEMPDLIGVALAGEVCSRKLIESLFQRFPGSTLRIRYASTEHTTVEVRKPVPSNERLQIL